MSDDETSHLSNLSDGAGCTEIWEHLSEQRAAADAESDADANAEAEDTDTVDGEQTADDSSDDAPDDAADTNAAGVPCP